MAIEMDMTPLYCTACMLQNKRLNQKQSYREMVAENDQWFVPATVQGDALGFSWCDAHAYRAELSAWFKAHGFPFVDCTPYGCAFAVWPDEDLAKQAILLASDEALSVLSIVIAEMDAQPTAIPDVHTLAALLPGEQQQAEEKGA